MSTLRDDPGNEDHVRRSVARPASRHVVHAGTMTERAVVSIGVGAAIGPALVARLAPAIEAAGFHALWVNDVPGADSLAVLAAAAGTTTRLTLAAGVIPVDRRPAGRIAVEVDEHGLPQERLVLGIGSGGATVGALQLVGDAASQLRSSLTARIVVGAVGPKMRRLAVERSDGVLLSWLRPDVAAEQSAQARAAASDPHVALYVRTALDPSARDRMQAEMRRYAAIPSYSANFLRQGAGAPETVLDASAHPVAERLASYRAAADEVVLRVITPSDSLEDCLSLSLINI